MEFHSTLNDQQERGTYRGMFENQKVEKFLDGLKHSHFIGLKSNILCNPKMCSDFNATAAHVKDMVNRTPTLKNPPGCQVAAMGRGGGRGRGTDRRGREGRGGRGGRGYDSGRGHGGRGNNQNRRSDRTPSAHTFRIDKCPDQDDVDRVKPSIVHHHVTSNRIFVDDNTYRNLMDANERHAMYPIRVDLKAKKDPLGKSGRKRTSEVAALHRTVQELSAHIGHYPGNRTENGNNHGQGQYPFKTDSHSNKNQPGLFRQSYSHANS